MSSTNPSDFKSVVETYATQFRGYEQHDSQEFFVWSCLSSHVDHAARFAAWRHQSNHHEALHRVPGLHVVWKESVRRDVELSSVSKQESDCRLVLRAKRDFCEVHRVRRGRNRGFLDNSNVFATSRSVSSLCLFLPKWPQFAWTSWTGSSRRIIRLNLPVMNSRLHARKAAVVRVFLRKSHVIIGCQRVKSSLLYFVLGNTQLFGNTRAFSRLFIMVWKWWLIL